MIFVRRMDAKGTAKELIDLLMYDFKIVCASSFVTI